MITGVYKAADNARLSVVVYSGTRMVRVICWTDLEGFENVRDVLDSEEVPSRSLVTMAAIYRRYGGVWEKMSTLLWLKIMMRMERAGHRFALQALRSIKEELIERIKQCEWSMPAQEPRPILWAPRMMCHESSRRSYDDVRVPVPLPYREHRSRREEIRAALVRVSESFMRALRGEKCATERMWDDVFTPYDDEPLQSSATMMIDGN